MGKSFDGLRRVTGEEDKSIPQDPVGTGHAMLKKGAGSMEQGGVDQGVIKRGGAPGRTGARSGEKALARMSQTPVSGFGARVRVCVCES